MTPIQLSLYISISFSLSLCISLSLFLRSYLNILVARYALKDNGLLQGYLFPNQVIDAIDIILVLLIFSALDQPRKIDQRQDGTVQSGDVDPNNVPSEPGATYPLSPHPCFPPPTPFSPPPCRGGGGGGGNGESINESILSPPYIIRYGTVILLPNQYELLYDGGVYPLLCRPEGGGCPVIMLLFIRLKKSRRGRGRERGG